MDDISQETLCMVTQNDPSLTKLRIIGVNNNNYGVARGKFYSDNSDDYSTLGSAIANNTHLESLEVILTNNLPLGVADRGFYDGLHHNSSISELSLYCGDRNIAGGVAQEILKVYQENNSHLTFLGIYFANLQSGGDRVIVDTLRSCTNLQRVVLNFSNVTDAQLLPIVDAVRGHRMLEELCLYENENNIGNVGCEALAALLIDPSCNLRFLSLERNAIGNEGATAIANSLSNNNKLQCLYLGGNQIDRSVQHVLCNILCNTSNINSLYASNHTLNMLGFGEQQPGQQLQSLLGLNADTNKNYVAMKKILLHFPNIDMEQLFQWDADGEQTLKALPHVMSWFDRAKVVVANDGVEYDIEERKLSAIFQFAKAMPLLFVPPSHINVDTKKRKRSD